MAKNIPTISVKQYESIQQLKHLNYKQENISNHVPDKLSIFLREYLFNLENRPQKKVFSETK